MMRFLPIRCHLPFALLALLALATHPAQASTTRGIFALSSGQPQIASRLSAVAARGRRYTFDIVQRRLGSNAPIHDYAVEYAKRLHLIVISDDFETFLHLHPALSADGHFRGTYSLPRTTHYRIYADTTPQGLSQQVFRFSLDAGGAAATRLHLGEPSRATQAGPYRVTLDTARFAAGREAVLRVQLAKAGRPADDLHGYLGAAAHAVFVNARTLTYAHVHPVVGAGAMAMTMTKRHRTGDPQGMAAMGSATDISDLGHVPPTYALHIGPQRPGTYELWLQFRGGRALYVAPFTLAVQ